MQTCAHECLAQTWPRHRFPQNSGGIAPCPTPVMCGKAVRMAPRLQPTSRKHTNEGNADFAVKHQAPLTTPTEQISPANQQHKGNDFFTRKLRWRSAFESSAIGITMADLDGHYLAANTVFQNMVGYAEPELQEFSLWDITSEEDRVAKFKLVRELVEGRRKHFQIETRYRRKDGALLWVGNNIPLVPGSGTGRITPTASTPISPSLLRCRSSPARSIVRHEAGSSGVITISFISTRSTKAVTSRRGNSPNSSQPRSVRRSDRCANSGDRAAVLPSQVST
jgi:PAS domain S-box-containing protein